MSLWGWVYDRAPKPVQQWLENREMDRMADALYELYWQSIQEGKAKEADLERLEDEDFAKQELEDSAHGPMKRVRNSDYIREPFGSTELNYSIGKSDDGYHYAINAWPAFGPDREGNWSEPFATQEEAEREANAAMRGEYEPGEGNALQAYAREIEDADLERLGHEQSTAAGTWSGDRGAELERLERSEQTHSERSLDEPPERGIEDDEEELER